MPTIVELPNKTEIEFPDGMDAATIQAEIAKAFPDLATANEPGLLARAGSALSRGMAKFGEAMAGQELPKAGVPAVTVPRFGEPGTFTRGVSEGVSTLVEGATTPEGVALLGLAGTPAIGLPVRAALLGAGVVETAKLTREASITGSPEALGQAAVIGGVTALGGRAEVKALQRGAKPIETVVDESIKPSAPASAEAVKATVQELAKPVEPAKPVETAAPEPAKPVEPAKPAPVRPEEAAELRADLAAELGPEMAAAQRKPAKAVEPAKPVTEPEAQPAKPAAAEPEFLEKVAFVDEQGTVTPQDATVHALAAKVMGGEITPFEWNNRGWITSKGRFVTNADAQIEGLTARPRTQATAAPAEPVLTSEPGEPPAPATAPPVEPIGMGGAVPAEFAPPKPFVTSVKNAAVDQSRAEMGLPPAMAAVRRPWPQVWDEAMRLVDEGGPQVIDDLVTSLKRSPRMASDTEIALLLHREIDLKNDYYRAARDASQAVDDGRLSDAEAAKGRSAELLDRMLELYTVTKSVGTPTAQALAARRMAANQDFSLAAMMIERRAIKGGKRLNDKETAEVEQAHKEISDALAEVEAADAAVPAGQPGAPGKPPGGPGAPTPPGGPSAPGKGPRTPAKTDAEFKLEKAKRRWQDKLRQDAEVQRPPVRRFVDHVGAGWNDIRAILTSFDFSAVLRQGKLVVLSRPILASRSLPSMFKAAVSEKGAFAIDKAILERPNARSGLYARSGLELTERGGALSKMEETYMSRLADKIPGVAASQRAYSTFLNSLRADTFDAMAATMSRTGEVTLPEAKIIAYTVNAFTGRGDLGRLQAAAVPLATILFAPRYVASRFQVLLGQPIYYGVLSGKVGWREGARARKLVAAEYGRVLTGIGVMYGLWQLAQPEIETSSISSDFLKPRFGDTRVDPLAGLIQTTVLMSRLASGESKTLRGEIKHIRGEIPYGSRNAWNVITDFGRTKLAPAPAALADVLTGKHVTGEPVTPKSMARQLLVPITYQDILDTMEEQGVPKGLAFTLLSQFGDGVATYNENKKR